MLRPTHAAALSALVLFGCNKLRKDSGDGGETASGSGGGGLLSFLSSGPFEGEIAFTITDKKSGKPPMNMVYEVKDPKMRLDVPADAPRAGAPGAVGKSVWMLVDPPQKKLYAVTDDEKKAIVFDLNKMAEDMKKTKGGGSPSVPGAGAPSKPPPKIEKTGKMDKVCGYECEIWKVTEENKNTEICAAKGITWFDLRSLGAGSLDPKAALLAELTDMNHFPLRVVQTENGAEQERMEATRCEKKKMPDARFQVPANYQIVDLAAMMQGFGGLPGMGSGRAPFPMPSAPRKK